MPSLDDRLREGLQEVAPPVSAASGVFDRVMSRRKAQRHIHRLQAIALIAAVAVGSGAVAGVLVWAFRIDRTPPRPASMSPLTEGMVFSNGQLLRFTPEGTEVVATLPEKTAPEPPVLTSSGVLVLTGGPSVGLQLWLVSMDGSVEEIAEDVTGGFAIDPLTDLVAYATAPVERSQLRYHSTVHLVDLNDRKEQATSPELDTFAEVRGIADGIVVLSTGDGASASVRVWIPGSQEIRRYSMYGRAEATDPQSGISVLDVGDGPSPILVRFETAPSGPEGSIVPGEIVVDPSVLQLDGVDFQPDGALVAGLQPTVDGVELVVLEETSGEVAFRESLPGGVQATWSGHDAVLVLDKRGRSGSIRDCEQSVGECAIVADDLPSGGRFGYGLWLVVGSFEQSESSPRPTVAETSLPAVYPAPGASCNSSRVEGDFDGDGTLDAAVVHPESERLMTTPGPSPCPPDPPSPPFVVEIRWGGGASGAWQIPECETEFCHAIAAVDLDGNGTDEVVLTIEQGASTESRSIFELPASEAGPIVFGLAPPGTSTYQPNEPLRLAWNGSAGYFDYITCETAGDGQRHVIQTGWGANWDQPNPTYSVKETVFAFDGSSEASEGTPRIALGFTVVSDKEWIVPYDPDNPPQPRGQPCWQEPNP